MPIEVNFSYGTDTYLVDPRENIPALRDAVTAAKQDGGGWVVFDTPGGGQTNIYIQADTEVKIIREVR